jgi:hypothetical protein
MTVEYICERTVESWQDDTIYGKYGRHLSRTVECWTDCKDILRRIVEYWTEPYTIGQELGRSEPILDRTGAEYLFS